MQSIPSMIFETIDRFMREHYQPQDISKTKEEAQLMADQVRRHAAGRVYMSPEWEAAYKSIEEYYEEKKAFEDLINATRSQLRGRKASERIPFL